MDLERIEVVASDDWTKHDITITRFLSSAGSYGCNFIGSYKLAVVLLKFIFVHSALTEPAEREAEKEDIRSAVMREAFIGNFLRTVPPQRHIQTMFAGTRALLHSSGSAPIPKDWADKMDQKCKDKKSAETYVLVQDYVDGTTLLEWTAGQSAKISADVIRSVGFQLTLALAYTHHKYGFQHNDVKLDNIMCRTVAKTTTKTFLLDNADVFEVVIPADGVEIVLIDFGGSALITSPNQAESPAFLRTGELNTAEYVAIDKYYFTDTLRTRKNDADLTGVFVVMLTMIAHKRFDNEKWIATDNFIKSMSKSFTKDTTVSLLQNLKLAWEDRAKETEVNLKFMPIFAVNLIIAMQFGLEMGNVKGIDKDVRHYLTLATNKPSRTSIAESIDFGQAEIAQMIQEAFGGGARGSVALGFMKLLFAPREEQRQAFGVANVPFNKHCLANALYHPFFGYDYWKQNAVVTGKEIALGRIGAPLIYRTDEYMDAMHAQVMDLAKTFEAASVRSAPKPAAPTPAPVPIPQKDKEEEEEEEEEQEEQEEQEEEAADTPDFSQCANNMRALAIDHMAKAPNYKYFRAIPGSKELVQFQQCINEIAAAYDKNNATAKALLIELKILDADGSASIVTATASGTGFNFTPHYETFEKKKVKGGILLFVDVSTNAAYILLGLYVVQKLPGWETVGKLKAALDKIPNSKLLPSIEKWVTDNLGFLFEPKKEASVVLSQPPNAKAVEPAPSTAVVDDITVTRARVTASLWTIVTTMRGKVEALTKIHDDASAQEMSALANDLASFALIFNANDYLKKAVSNVVPPTAKAKIGWAVDENKEYVAKETFVVLDAPSVVFKGANSPVSKTVATQGYVIARVAGKSDKFDADLLYHRYVEHLFFVYAAYYASKGLKFDAFRRHEDLSAKLLKQDGLYRSGLEQKKTYKGYLALLVESQIQSTAWDAIAMPTEKGMVFEI
jgi:serine/threonine protein kinase